MTPPTRGRGGASRRRIVVRRVIALLALLAAFALAAWLASVAVNGVAADDPPPTTTTALAAPPPKPLRIVFPEGYTRKEMAARVAAVRKIARTKRKVDPRIRQARYLALTERSRLPAQFAGDTTPRTLEGFLFPATYDFTAKTTTRQLVEKQLAAFRKAWKQVDMRYARTKNLTPYDVLIIASMVEKETIAPDERPLVAAVIYNRLKAGMPLGIDATIRYGLDVPGTEPLRQSHLNSDSPYNTRNRRGLPPTPIANPGLASMQAAAHPAEVKYLYFVRKPDKVHHFFTASEAEFYARACQYGYGCG
ncbi:MAG: endolytic transglycosylase MltG [Pseudomonadota bacterium]